MKGQGWRVTQSLNVPNLITQWCLKPRLNYNYFRFGRTNGRLIEILLPVTILTCQPSSSSRFASEHQRQKVVCSRCSKMEWSTVSNTADISNRIMAATSSWSTAYRMSESRPTLNTAVSVEWPDRNLDCKERNRSGVDRYALSRRTWTRHSRSFNWQNGSDTFGVCWDLQW